MAFKVRKLQVLTALVQLKDMPVSSKCWA